MSEPVPNSFGVTVSASRLIELRQRDQLGELRRSLRGESALILGDGSNVLFAADPSGPVLLNRLAGIDVLDEDEHSARLQVAAGESWDGLVDWACGRGYWGLENLALIPGRVGAAPIQNIGAYGVEFAEHCVEVEVLDEAGRLSWLTAEQCRFGYRDSLFKQTTHSLWITAVRLRLSRQPAPKLEYSGLTEELATCTSAELTPRRVAEAVRAIRRRKLPDPEQLGNAGSFFKNPLVTRAQWQSLQSQLPRLPAWPGAERIKLSAAFLIEAAGWKGQRRGDAGVAPGHALVLVNHGRASGAQILALAQDIQTDVQQRFGVWLEPEPRILGATPN